MKNRNNKIISAISTALINRLIDISNAEYYQNNREELYAILDRANMRFSNDKQTWVERTFKKRRASRVKATARRSPKTGNDYALLRIIAPSENMDYILSQMNELIPCLNGEVVSESKRYPGDGTWERVYLRVRFSQLEGKE